MNRKGQQVSEYLWDMLVTVLVVSGFFFWVYIGYCIVHGRPW